MPPLDLTIRGQSLRGGEMSGITTKQLGDLIAFAFGDVAYPYSFPMPPPLGLPEQSAERTPPRKVNRSVRLIDGELVYVVETRAIEGGRKLSDDELQARVDR